MQALRVWFDAAGAGESWSGECAGSWDLRIIPIAWHSRDAMLGTVVSNLSRSGVPVVLRITLHRRDRRLRSRVRELRGRVAGRAMAIAVDCVGAEGRSSGL